MRFTILMPFIRRLILPVLSLCPFIVAHATDYYISSNGNDGNNGTTELTPFQHISRLNQIAFGPGDRIFFHRGEVFRGQLSIPFSGSASQPIIVDAYSTGTEPVIKGSEMLDSWAPVGTGIYKASLANEPAMVFQNGLPQTLARYPNTGFLNVETSNGYNVFTDNDLNFPDNYFTDANVHMRTVRFSYEERVVESHVSKTINLKATTANFIAPGTGYYFSGKREFIDVPTEYYYDKAAGVLELKTANGLSPAPGEIEVNVYDFGVYTQGSHVAINNIKFQHQRKAGVNSFGFGAGISISHCSFNEIYGRAFNIISKDGVNIRDNYISDMWAGGFTIYGSSNVIIERNEIRRIGIGRPGVATEGVVPYFGGILDGSSAIFRYNVMDSIGYDCLTLWRNTTVEKNVFSNFCMTTDDGSAIYIGGPLNGGTDGTRNGTGCFIRNNIVKDFTGNAEATTDPERNWVFGIFMDQWSGNAVIENNTVMNSPGTGIFIYNSVGNTVNNNTVFDCRQAGISVSHTSGGPIVKDNLFSNNILYSLHDGDLSVSVANYDNGDPNNTNMGAFINNYYLNPYTATPAYIAYWGMKNGVYQLLQFYLPGNEWKAMKDPGAKFSAVNWKSFEVASITGPDLLSNGTFNNDLKSWECWAGIPGNSCNYSWTPTGPLDGGQVFLQSLWDDYGSFHNDRSAMFSLSAGQEYLLKYSVVGNENKTHGVNLYDGVNYTGLSSTFIEPVTTTRTEHSIVFTPTGSSNHGMVGFRVGPDFITTYWLDNISLVPVTTRQLNPHDKNFIYVNPTDQPKIFYLMGAFQDIDGSPVSGDISVAPWSSRILLAREIGTVLPLSIRNLKATALDAHSSLVEWEADATNAACTIEIQKSANGIDFSTIGLVQTQTGTGLHHYSFSDVNFSKTAFYRLRSYCAGEQGKLSSIVRLNKNVQNQEILVYPNPVVSNNFQVNNPGKYTTAAITSYDGRLIKRFKLVNGINAMVFDQPSGVYFITFKGPAGSETQRLIKH